MEIRTLKIEEMEAWFDHCMYCFNKGEYNYEYRQLFVNHWTNDPWRDLDSILAAFEDNEILSTVRVFHRNIYFNGEEVSMGGIGEVCTKPAYRGRGLSTKLLEAAIHLMEERKIKISMLSTGLYSFYARLGWKEITLYEKTVDLTGKCRENPNIHPVDFDKDCVQLMKIHKEYNNRLNGPVVRYEEPYWKNWVKNKQHVTHLIWENDEGRATAYILGEEKNSTLYIREFGALKEYNDVFDPLVSHLCVLIDRGVNTINFPAVIKSSFPKEFTNEKVLRCNPHMLRLITPFNVNEISINSTEKLVEMMYGEDGCCPDSRFVFWKTDGF